MTFSDAKKWVLAAEPRYEISEVLIDFFV